LIEGILEYFDQKITINEIDEHKITIKKSELAKEKHMTKVPLKSINVLKGDTVWFDKKQEDLLKELSIDYYNAMKESYNGTTGLTNKWLIWNQRPIGGYGEFSYPRNKRRKRVKQFMTLMWKKYKNSFKGTVYFDEYEKLRAMDFQLNKIIQMGDLSQFFYNKLQQCW
jgi:hypothetical protein